ncbi:MAG: D-alanyl-D-alanine carboxypeptidase/D-alanyl-D-alanine-endopeptidase [Dysgonamonadaceae bacterium]|nr:D-alanyl-D-alanine carboxypeptidase/D-alanyl-D-alanine-endopeptidase [Dysgonamonadaceae bacterium]
MKRKIYYLLSICWLLSSIWEVPAQVPPALKAFIQKENLRHAAIGFKVVDMGSEKVIADYNSSVSLTPASCMKIVTTATALDVLGAGFRYETPLLYDGFINNSVLEGNLYVLGTGDPTLGSEYFEDNRESFPDEWLAGIQASGIRSVSGDLIVLDQLFGYEGISKKWLWEDLGNYYAPGIYAISVFDNMYSLQLQSYSDNTQPVILSITPEIEGISFINDITVKEANRHETAIFGLPFSYERRLYGTMPPNRTSYVLKGDIPDPGLLLAKYLKTYWQQYGVIINGKATTARLNIQSSGNRNVLAKVQSPSLAAIIHVINVKSNNHFSEHLFRTLQMKAVDIPAYWKEKGLDSSALFMHDGSGIAPANAVSTGFLLDLLLYMDKKEGREGAFFQSLPVAGKEGTVTSFLKNTSLQGKAYVKSGSMTDVQSYSGYVEKGNKRYAFSLIINRFTGERSELRKEIEQLLTGLF